MNIYWHPWFGPVFSTLGYLEVSTAENSSLVWLPASKAPAPLLQILRSNESNARKKLLCCHCHWFFDKNMDNASLNNILVIFAFSWIFSDNKLWMLFQSTSFRSFLLSPEYFLTTNMDDASLSFIQVIFAVWIFLIDIASIKFIFAFSWIFHEKNVVHSSHKQ